MTMLDNARTMERHAPAPMSGEFPLGTADFGRITALLRHETGIELAAHKMMLVYSRLSKRLRALGVVRFSDYCDLVESERGRDERGAMCTALTTTVTRFNREPHHFMHLEHEALPDLRAKVMRGGRLRLWSAACSSGEEPYSIALALLAAIPDAPSRDVRVLATDINPAMVAAGVCGRYDQSALDPLDPRRRHLGFAPAGDGIVEATPALRALVSFHALNLIADWPMRGPFDAIFCRNVAIYFSADTQARLWDRLSAILAPGGWLYIGHSERLAGPAAGRMDPAGVTIYRKRGRTGE